jgi:hypothetical protein
MSGTVFGGRGGFCVRLSSRPGNRCAVYELCWRDNWSFRLAVALWDGKVGFPIRTTQGFSGFSLSRVSLCTLLRTPPCDLPMVLAGSRPCD